MVPTFGSTQLIVRIFACWQLHMLLSLGDRADVCVPKHERACLGNGKNFVKRDGPTNPFNGVGTNAASVDRYLAHQHIVDWDGDTDLDIIIGNNDGQIFYFENIAGLTFVERTGDRNPFDFIREERFVSPQAVDWDGDDDLDLLVGDAWGELHYFERLPDGTLVERNGTNGPNPFEGINVSITACPHAVDWDGDGDLDLIVGDGARVLHYFERISETELVRPSKANIMADAFDQIRVPQQATPWTVDWDNDGDEDLFAGDLFGHVHYWERTAPDELVARVGRGVNPFHTVDDHDVSSLLRFGETQLRVRPQILDWDGDGDFDLVLGNEYGNLIYFEQMLDDRLEGREGPGVNPFENIFVNDDSQPVAADWDGDGDVDLVVGCKEGFLIYYERQPDSTLVKPAVNPFGHIDDVSSYAAPELMDWDNDGDLDLLVGTFWGSLFYYERLNATHVAEEAINLVHEIDYEDSWAFANTNPHAVDWDGDGDLDLLVGSHSAGVVYLERINATHLEWRGPLTVVYFNDSLTSPPARGLFYTAPVAVDADGDGLVDHVVIGEYGGILRYCLKVSDLEVKELRGSGVDPFYNVIVGENAAPALVDWDGDKDLDLIVGETAGHLSYYERGSCEVMPTCSWFGVCNYLDSTCQCVSGYRGDPTCGSCQAGYYRDQGEDVLSCTRCPTGTMSPAADSPCEPCPGGSVPTETQTACDLCIPGTYAASGAEACTGCDGDGGYSLAGASSCNACAAGRYPLPGGIGCQDCPAGRSSESGDPTCSACRSDMVASEGSVCKACPAVLEPDAEQARCSSIRWHVVAGIVSAGIMQFLLVFMFLWHVKRTIRIEDLTTVNGKNILTTLGPHYILPGKTPAVVRLEGTTLPSDGQLFTARPMDPVRLELEPVVAHGGSGRIGMEASMGTIVQPSLRGLLTTNLSASGRRLPLPYLALLLPVPWWPCYALGIGRGHVILILVGTLLALPAVALSRLGRRQPTVVEQLVRDFKRNYVTAPLETPPGPSRAVSLASLNNLYFTFESVIRGRNAYYLNSNITKRITEGCQLSFAEATGPARILFFVSHFWGTPFHEFVTSIQHHAETATMPPDARMSYWICFLSNNQWRLHEEVREWNDSSFYLALSSDACVATCMVTDVQALPLTRSWCLFEVLLTFEREARQENQGLLFCTASGVMNTGLASYDASAGLALKLADLRVEDATASYQKDKEMIDNFVIARGGFPNMNHYLRQKATQAMGQEQEHFNQALSDLERSLNLFDPVRTHQVSDQVSTVIPVDDE